MSLPSNPTRFIQFDALQTVSVQSETVSTENLAPNEAVLRAETSIISAGTELARLAGLETGTGSEFPIRPGYGAIGTIIAKGEALKEFTLSQRVFYAGKHAEVQRFEHGQDHQWSHLFPVPSQMDPVAASVGCMAQIAYTAPHIAEIDLGDTVAVFGLGMVGLLSALLCQARGARVIGLDPLPQRAALARRVGLKEVLNVAPGDQVEALKAATGGNGAEVTIDGTGHTGAVLNAIESTALFGQVILLGTPRAPFDGNITTGYETIHRNGLLVRGAHMWRFPLKGERNVKQSVQRNFEVMFAMIRDGQLPARELISHVVQPEEVPAIYGALRESPADYNGVVIDWR